MLGVWRGKRYNCMCMLMVNRVASNKDQNIRTVGQYVCRCHEETVLYSLQTLLYAFLRLK